MFLSVYIIVKLYISIIKILCLSKKLIELQFMEFKKKRIEKAKLQSKIPKELRRKHHYSRVTKIGSTSKSAFQVSLTREETELDKISDCERRSDEALIKAKETLKKDKKLIYDTSLIKITDMVEEW